MSRFTEFSLGVTLLIFAVASNTVRADPATAYASSASAKCKAAREVYDEAKTMKSNAPGGRKLRQSSALELLVAAIVVGDKIAFRQLVKKVDLNDVVRIGGVGFTPLEVAILEGKVDFIFPLIKYGADPNRVNAGGITPLVWAVLLGDSGAAKELLDHGADPNRSAPGEEPLLLASILGNFAVANVLLEGGADPTATIAGLNYLDLACACLLDPELDEFCNC